MKSISILITVFITLVLAASSLPQEMVSNSPIHPVMLSSPIGTDQNQSMALYQNITVNENSTLTFKDLDASVLPGYVVVITVYGKFIIENSSIVAPEGENASLHIILLGNDGNQSASLILRNSSITASGEIIGMNSAVYMVNSNLDAFPDKESARSGMRIILKDSKFLMVNSSAGGLYSSPGRKSFEAAFLNYSGDPISSTGLIHLNIKPLSPSNVQVSRIIVNVTYSGNNPFKTNTLNLLIGNVTIFQWEAKNTGSVYIKKNATFSVNISGESIDLKTFLTRFSAYLNLSFDRGSNTTIWSLRADVISDDVVDENGLYSYNYLFENTTAIIYRSILSLNRVPSNDLAGLRNPQSNKAILSNGTSMYFAESTITGRNGTAYPFITDGNSTVYTYIGVSIKPRSGPYVVKNYTMSIHPSDLNASRVLLSHAFSRRLMNELTLFNSSLIEYTNINKSIKNLLPESFISNNSTIQTLNYVAVIDNRSFHFSLPAFPSFGRGPTVLDLPLKLPLLHLFLSKNPLYEDARNTVQFKITSLLHNSGPIYWNLTLSGNNIRAFSNGTIQDISANRSRNVSVDFKTGSSMFSGYARYILHLDVRNYSVNGRNITLTRNVPVYVNALPSLHGLAGWMNYGILNVTAILANKGNQTVNSTLMVTLSHNSKHIMRKEMVSLHRNETMHVSFHLAGINGSLLVSLILYSNNTHINPMYSVLEKEIEIGTVPVYRIGVSEVGLTNSTEWSFTISHKNFTIARKNVDLFLPNGTYEFNALPVEGYHLKSSPTTITIAGHGYNVVVRYQEIKYKLTIVIEGLNTNSTWTLLIQNGSTVFRSHEIHLLLPNGTYSLGIKTQVSTHELDEIVTINGSSVNLYIIPPHVSNSVSHAILLLLERYFALEVAAGGSLTLYLYWRFHETVKVCSTCLSTFYGWGKCPACGGKGSTNVIRKKE